MSKVIEHWSATKVRESKEVTKKKVLRLILSDSGKKSAEYVKNYNVERGWE